MAANILANTRSIYWLTICWHVMGNMTQVMFSHQTGQNNGGCTEDTQSTCHTSWHVHHQITITSANWQSICKQHLYVGYKSKECQQRVPTNTRPNCAQSTQDPILLAQSSSMVVLVSLCNEDLTRLPMR